MDVNAPPQRTDVLGRYINRLLLLKILFSQQWMQDAYSTIGRGLVAERCLGLGKSDGIRSHCVRRFYTFRCGFICLLQSNLWDWEVHSCSHLTAVYKMTVGKFLNPKVGKGKRGGH